MNINLLVTVYAVFIIIFLIFSYAGIYHLRRFGYAGDLTKPIIILYSLLSLAIIIASILALVSEIYGGL